MLLVFVFGFIWALQIRLFRKYVIDEWSNKRIGKSLEDFELKYIDVSWRQEASKIHDNETIYVIRYLQEYKAVPYSWDVGLRKD